MRRGDFLWSKHGQTRTEMWDRINPASGHRTTDHSVYRQGKRGFERPCVRFKSRHLHLRNKRVKSRNATPPPEHQPRFAEIPTTAAINVLLYISKRRWKSNAPTSRSFCFALRSTMVPDTPIRCPFGLFPWKSPRLNWASYLLGNDTS